MNSGQVIGRFEKSVDSEGSKNWDSTVLLFSSKYCILISAKLEYNCFLITKWQCGHTTGLHSTGSFIAGPVVRQLNLLSFSKRQKNNPAVSVMTRYCDIMILRFFINKKFTIEK